MAEILRIQLKIPLHESKREKKERENKWQPHIYIYIHHQLTICTYVCRRRTKTNSRPVTLARARSSRSHSLRTTVASQRYFSSFSPLLTNDTLDVVSQMTLIRTRRRSARKRERETGERTHIHKKSVITRFEVDADAPSCQRTSERAASYYRSRVAATAVLVRK